MTKQIQKSLLETLNTIQCLNNNLKDLLSAIMDADDQSKLEPNRASVKEWMSIEEAAVYTGYKRNSLYQMVHAGQITACNPTGGHLLFKQADLDRFLSRKKKSADYDLAEQAAIILNTPCRERQRVIKMGNSCLTKGESR